MFLYKCCGLILPLVEIVFSFIFGYSNEWKLNEFETRETKFETAICYNTSILFLILLLFCYPVQFFNPVDTIILL